MIGAPALIVNQKRENGPPFSPASAENGLSVDATSGKIVLGDDGSLNPVFPGEVTSLRFIKLNGAGIEIFNSASNFTTGGQAVLGLTSDLGNGVIFPLALSLGLAGAAIAAVMSNGAGNCVGCIVQANADLATGEFGVNGNSGTITAGLRNVTIVRAVNAAAPNVVLYASTGGVVSIWRPIAAVDTELYRFLLPAQANLNFPNTAAQNSADLTINVPGATDGDAVILGVPIGSQPANTSYSAFVSAANTVTVRFNNYSAAAVDPAAGNFKVAVIRLLP